MRIDNPSISGSLSFIGGTNSISATSVSLTGSLSGTFEGAFSGDSLTNISGAFNSVSESLALDITANASSITSLNAASSSYLLNTTDTLDGDLTVTGKITAQEFHTEFVSASILYESGSTQFGNSADDTHVFTGSIRMAPDSDLTIDRTLYVGHIDSGADSTLAINAQSGFGIIDLGSTYTQTSRLRVNYIDSGAGTGSLRIANDGNVGIGITSPSTALHVRDAGNPTITLDGSDAAYTSILNLVGAGGGGSKIVQSGGANTLIFEVNSQDRLTILGDGNVGIGTTEPSEKLEVNGAIRINNYISADTNYISYNQRAYYTDNWKKTSSGRARQLQIGEDNSGTLEYRISAVAGGAADDVITWSTIFTANDNGNIGIGVNTPTAKLHVNQPNHNEDTIGYASSTALWRLRNETVSGNPTGRFTLYNSGNATVNIEGSDGRVTYFNAGNVGVGITAPSAKLHVDGVTLSQGLYIPGLVNLPNAQGGIQISMPSTSYNAIRFYDAVDESSHTIHGFSTNWGGGVSPGHLNLEGITAVSFGTWVDPQMIIHHSSGNVGIGVGDSTPTQKLHVEGSGIFGTSTYRASLDGSSAGAYLRYGTLADPDSLGTIGTYSSAMMYETSQSGGHVFSTGAGVNGTERVRIDNSGWVGINTSSPSDLLHIHRLDGDTRYIRAYMPDATTYNAAGYNTAGRVAAGLRFNWYSNYWQIGAARGASTDLDGLVFSYNGATSMVLSESSFLGIGTTGPTQKLHIRNGYLLIDTDTPVGTGIWMPDTAGNPSLRLVTDQSGGNWSSIVNAWGNSSNPGVMVGSVRNDGTAFQVRSGVTLTDGFANDTGNVRFYVAGDGRTVATGDFYSSSGYHYSDGSVMFRKRKSVNAATTTTVLTFSQNGSYAHNGGGELLLVFVDPGSPWGVHVWKGLLTIRCVQYGSYYGTGVTQISERDDLDGDFTVSVSTSKTGGQTDGVVSVNVTTSSGISGVAYVSFNGWMQSGGGPV